MRFGAVALGLMAVCSFATSARADGPGDARLAQALFEEGRNLMEQKRYAEACPKLQESQRLDPGGGTLLNLAACHMAEGKLASALDEYHEALTIALRDNRNDREKIARTNIDRLEREVPRVTVNVTHFHDGLEVKLDTTPLAPAAWGVATPVDPGPHTVVASAPQHQTIKIQANVRAGDRKVIDVPSLKTDELATSEAKTTYLDPRTRPNPVFWAGLAAGFAGFAVFTVTGVMTVTSTLDANAGCSEPRQFCLPDARDSRDAARTLGWVSTIALGASVVGFLVAAIAPSKKVVAPRTVGTATHFLRTGAVAF